jgi:hypothetical protein
MNMNDPFVLALVALIISIIGVSLLLYIERNKDLLRLWTDYDIAKLSGDKSKALEAGKAFYMRKKGKLTIDDEQAIANDLCIMK